MDPLVVLGLLAIALGRAARARFGWDPRNAERDLNASFPDHDLLR